jgi:glycosyltransferase involved in cell wall biosynthesis
MKASELSVIIITFNRRDKVEQCLNCLERQTISDFEVVIVIDGSTDDTQSVLKRYMPQNFSLSIFNKQNEGRSLSRNYGASKAKGNFLLFFDDDMQPYPECLSKHLNLIEKNDTVISVGTQEEDLSMIRNDFDRFRFEIAKKWDDSVEHPLPDSFPYLTGANVALRKRIFSELGGFDRRAEVVEDFDLGMRAVSKNFKVVYNSEARARHDNVIDCETYVRKQIEYHRSFENLTKLGRGFINPSEYHPRGIKRLMYYFVSRQFFIPLIDGNFFVWLIPRAIRYKFYDILITGLSKVYPQRFTRQEVKYHA